MKKALSLVCLIIGFVFCVSSTASAELGHVQEAGGFFGIGGLVGGFEVHELKAIGGGLTSQSGYKLNEFVSLYVQSDGYFTNDSGVNFMVFNFVPTVKFNVYETLYLYAGAGYTGMYAWGGATFSGVRITGSSFKHGFGGDAGIGYEFYLNDHWSVAPQGGVNYSYVANGHLITPNIRVNFNYHF